VFMEAAKALGLRIVKEGGKTDLEKLRFAFRLCTSRNPDETPSTTRALGLLCQPSVQGIS